MKKAAVIGGVHDRNKFANKALRAFLQAGYMVYPVHPAHAAVEGLVCHPSITQIPEKPHIISIYVGPDILKKILHDIAQRGCDELWLNPGTSSPEILREAKELGLRPVETCSILALGFSPAQF